jgi:hypothetical protein
MMEMGMKGRGTGFIGFHANDVAPDRCLKDFVQGRSLGLLTLASKHMNLNSQQLPNTLTAKEPLQLQGYIPWQRFNTM